MLCIVRPKHGVIPGYIKGHHPATGTSLEKTAHKQGERIAPAKLSVSHVQRA